MPTEQTAETGQSPYFYKVQGGGTAEVVNRQIVWLKPPDWFSAFPGEPIPAGWSVDGPYDRQSGRQVR